ncbi:MAG: choice-of-anchor D domain-containing protein [Myxococcales bacterium]|nr:choice-of-anchor D domain-containing protein [Myxococcales bacterium]
MKRSSISLSIAVGVLAFACGSPAQPADGTIADASFDAAESDATTDVLGPDRTDDGEQGRLEIDRTLVSFGDWLCHTTPAMPQGITVRNPTRGVARYTVSLQGDHPEFYRLIDTGSGVIAAGGSVTIRASQEEPSLPLTANTQGVRNALVVIDAGTLGTTSVALTSNRVGADLQVDGGDFDFGDVAPGSSRSVVVQLRNVGTAATTVDVRSTFGNPFVLDLPGAPGVVSLAAGATLLATLTYAPIGVGEHDGTATFATGNNTCQSNAEVGTLTARGRATRGSLRVSGDVDFGRVNCGATASARTVELTNAGTAPLTWSASLGLGPTSSFRVSPMGGTLAPGASAPVTVTPSPIPSYVPSLPAIFEDSLSFESSASGDPPRTIRLRQEAQGAILRWSGPMLQRLRALPGLVATSEAVSLENVGNLTTSVSTGLSAGSLFGIENGPRTIAPGASKSYQVSYTPRTATDTATTSVTVTAPTLCTPVPPAPVVMGQPHTEGLDVGRESIVMTSPCRSRPGREAVPLTATGTIPIAVSIGFAPTAGANHFRVVDESGAPIAGRTVQPGTRDIVYVEYNRPAVGDIERAKPLPRRAS